jgi:hypothetical protein
MELLKIGVFIVAICLKYLRFPKVGDNTNWNERHFLLLPIIAFIL